MDERINVYLASIGLTDVDSQAVLDDGSPEDWVAGLRAFEAIAAAPSETFDSIAFALMTFRVLVRCQGSEFYARYARRLALETIHYERTILQPAPSASASILSRRTPLPVLPRAKPRLSRPSAVRCAVAEFGSLHGAEVLLQRRWLRRLDLIRERARLFCSIPEVPEIHGIDARALSLGGGAWRTIRGHVKRFEGYEHFLGDGGAFPIRLNDVARYAGAIHKHCGTSVLPRIFTSINWVSQRLGVEGLVLPQPLLTSIQELVISRHGSEMKELREAVRYHFYWQGCSRRRCSSLSLGSLCKRYLFGRPLSCYGGQCALTTLYM